jgi:hypothetical protein
MVAHGIQGFDYERARKDLDIPDRLDVMLRHDINREECLKRIFQ